MYDELQYSDAVRCTGKLLSYRDRNLARHIVSIAYGVEEDVTDVTLHFVGCKT